MLDKWADGDENVKRDLWRNLHAAGDALRDALNASGEGDCVIAPNPIGAPTDAMRSAAFNYAEGFTISSTVTAQDVLDAYDAIRAAALAQRDGIPLHQIADALQWAMNRIGAPDDSRTDEYRRQYHRANSTLFELDAAIDAAMQEDRATTRIGPDDV